MTEEKEKPSIHTVLFWLIQDKKIDSELLLDVLEFFWPTFIEKDGYIFSKESFSEKKYNTLISEDSNPEYWINLLTVDDFFSGTPNWEEKSSSLAKALTSIWAAKLKSDFPTMNFTVKYLHSEEDGDYGLTFYQTNKQSRFKKKSKKIQNISHKYKRKSP